MYTPIINPMYIYLLSLADKFIILFTVVASVAFGFAVIYVLFKIIVDEVDESTQGIKWRYVKILSIIGGIALFVLILLPPRDTLIQMYVASKITPQLVKDAVSTGKSFKDEIKQDIIDLLNYDKQDSTKSE